MGDEVGVFAVDGNEPLGHRDGVQRHLAKEHVVLDCAQQYGTNILVETGTLFGDMVCAAIGSFSQICSIELDQALAARAARRFRKCLQVSIMQGDSAQVLPGVLATIHEPALFWLDGHHCGDIARKDAPDTPVRAELVHILGHGVKDHVILIDDAHCFDGTHDYPTLEELRALVLTTRPDCSVTQESNIIRIHNR